MNKPLMFDLFCGLGGATEGFLETGWECIGIDNECHQYGEYRYPAQLVLQDIRTVSGHQLRKSRFIWASPPCNEYSWMAMPWRVSKRVGQALHGGGSSEPLTLSNGTVVSFDDEGFPAGYTGSRTLAELNELFNACFRIQREASEAAGRHIPMIVENVCGAQKWVGPARWHFGSFYLWGDVPALMPIEGRKKIEGTGSWFYSKDNPDAFCWRKNGYIPPGLKGADGGWFNDLKRQGKGETGRLSRSGSKSGARKAASAMIAKIPLPLSRHIARVYRNQWEATA